MGIGAACAWMVGLTFVVAGLIKLVRLKSFADELAGYELVPQRWRNVLATTVTLLELLFGIASAAPETRVAGLLGIIALLGLFTAAVVGNLLAGQRDISCACFGRSSQTLSWRIVLRNAGLAAAAIVGLVGGDAVLPTLPGGISLALALVALWLVWGYVSLVATVRDAR